ncbi:hypothetical protein E2C01_010566 [Portunus trituberculatus]|uniref:Uncharacterized protein n=1 Tax=Portunus trituberculatus TaxID=210409 RepID=A0A5B7D907_PORTR|nr:hypothetical protein [Portunus trituberculatus]
MWCYANFSTTKQRKVLCPMLLTALQVDTALSERMIVVYHRVYTAACKCREKLSSIQTSVAVWQLISRI